MTDAAVSGGVLARYVRPADSLSAKCLPCFIGLPVGRSTRAEIAARLAESERHDGTIAQSPQEEYMASIELPTSNFEFDSPDHQAKLADLYRDFETAGMTPLWRTREGLMPASPQPRAVPHLWRWEVLHELAERSAALVPVGRGGERRAIGLGNPGLSGEPFATPDAVGGDPVPRATRERSGAPAHPVRIPIRPRRGGRLDGRRRRPGGNAPW